jgi:hypothetical protein
VHQRALDLATSLRLVIATAVGAAAVVLAPTLSTESPSAVVLASLALLVAAVVRVAGLGARRPALAVAVTLTRAAESSLHRPARVTDRVHHPIRPRAPGC